MKTNSKPRRRVVLIVLTAVVLVLVIAAGIYFGTYYHAGDEAIASMKSDDAVTVSSIDGGTLFDGPSDDTAIVFYPGAKVDSAAYAPILHEIAARDADVFLLDMPLHMAVFDIDAADSIRNTYSYDHWYMAGHSMGAAMASVYVSDHLDEYDGIILLAGYPAADLHRDGFRCLSIYGTNDLDPASQKKNEEDFPEDTTFVTLDGGNHAGFADYGPQKGDGTATISKQQQWTETEQWILTFLRMGA